MENTRMSTEEMINQLAKRLYGKSLYNLTVKECDDLLKRIEEGLKDDKHGSS